MKGTTHLKREMLVIIDRKIAKFEEAAASGKKLDTIKEESTPLPQTAELHLKLLSQEMETVF